MFNHVTDQQFDALSKRYEKVKTSGFRGVDPRIVPTVEKLASLKGVVPVWSCSGHPAAEQLARKPDGRVRLAQTRHVIFSVTDEPHALFDRYSQWCLNAPYALFLAYRPRLTALFLNWGFNSEGGRALGQDNKVYSLWELAFTYKLDLDGDVNNRNTATDPKLLEEHWASLINHMVQP